MTERVIYKAGQTVALTCRPGFPMTVELHDVESKRVVVVWLDHADHVQRSSFIETMLTATTLPAAKAK